MPFLLVERDVNYPEIRDLYRLAILSRLLGKALHPIF
jgi:hypothetical protein